MSWRLFIVCAATVVGCVAPEPPDMGPGEEHPPQKDPPPVPEPECFCDVLSREGPTISVPLDCLCAKFGCPASSTGVPTPSADMISSLECGDRVSYAFSAPLAGSIIHTFERATGLLIGSARMADHPAYCEAVEVSAGEIARPTDCQADWCILSWGPLQVAEPGECLLYEDLVNPDFSDPVGSGGAGGAGTNTP